MSFVADESTPRDGSPRTSISTASAPAAAPVAPRRFDRPHPGTWPHVSVEGTIAPSRATVADVRVEPVRFMRAVHWKSAALVAGALMSGIVIAQWLPVPRDQAAPAQVVAPAAEISSQQAGITQLLARTYDARCEVRREAVLELGRRGALKSLEELRSHPQLDVQATVPLALLHLGRGAHAEMPWLAEGLHSPHAEVRRNTAMVLRRLVSLYGPYSDGEGLLEMADRTEAQR